MDFTEDVHYNLGSKELNIIAKNIYESYFKKPFTGYVVWSNRMVNIAGNCREDGRIALNRKYYLMYGYEEIIFILKHELAHLYCFLTYGNHTHEDTCFLNALKKLKGSMIGKSMPTYVHVYCCPQCNKKWNLKRKLNGNFSCSECGKGLFSKKCEVIYLGKDLLTS